MRSWLRHTHCAKLAARRSPGVGQVFRMGSKSPSQHPSSRRWRRRRPRGKDARSGDRPLWPTPTPPGAPRTLTRAATECGVASRPSLPVRSMAGGVNRAMPFAPVAHGRSVAFCMKL